MQNFMEALQVKDCTIFNLVQHTFYKRDFVFFMHLGSYLSKMTGCNSKKAIEFGELAQLLYLSSLLHVSITEKPSDIEQLRGEKQMPVLLGDLVYGRFISTLIATENRKYLSIYISYLKLFNESSINVLDGTSASGSFTIDSAAEVLTEKTAEIFALETGVSQTSIIVEAKKFFAEEWAAAQEQTITTMAELNTLLRNEFSQGAMVC